jgi:hypothetical protein
LILPPTEDERLHHLLSSRDSLLGEEVGVRVGSDLEDRSKGFLGIFKVVGKDEVEDGLTIETKGKSEIISIASSPEGGEWKTND